MFNAGDPRKHVYVYVFNYSTLLPFSLLPKQHPRSVNVTAMGNGDQVQVYFVWSLTLKSMCPLLHLIDWCFPPPSQRPFQKARGRGSAVVRGAEGSDDRPASACASASDVTFPVFPVEWGQRDSSTRVSSPRGREILNFPARTALKNANLAVLSVASYEISSQNFVVSSIAP